MKKTSLLIISLLAISSFFVASCQSGDPRFPGFTVAENGLIYQFGHRSDSTVAPVTGDFVTLIMTYGKKDSVVFDSRTIPQDMVIPMIAPLFKGDIYDAIGMMHIGDSATFILPADSVFKKLFRMPSTPPEFAKEPFMYFNVKLLKIQSQAEMDAEKQALMEQQQAEENAIRTEFLTANFPNAQPTASGLYVIVQTEGKGASPVAGQKVTVHYVGTFLDGTQFDSSVDRGQPFEFVLGQGQVIPGWDEGVALMKKGEKSTLVIPSSLAYGPGRQGIPPFSTLVFEVELINFQ